MRGSAFEHQMPMSAADRGEIDLVALFREIGRRKWRVLLFTLGVFVLATVAVNVIKPRFTSETRVFIENRDTEYTRIGRDSTRGPDPLIDQDAVLSQTQLILSRDIARAMIQRFDLGSRAEFDDVLNGVDAATKVGVMLGIINNPAGVSPEERVLEKYFDKLKAFAVAKSRVIAVEFQSRDPKLAAQLSDAIAEEYIRQLELAKKTSAKSAGNWLGRTIDTLRDRVAQAEARVEEYRTKNGLFLVSSAADNTNISSQQLSELNTQLATARAQQSELTAKARIIREAVRQGRIFEVSDVVNNESVRRMIETRANLKAQIAQEERTLLPQHPRIKELYAQLSGMEEQVRNAADRTARALENDARAAGARVAASQAELDQQKRQSGTANEQEVQLRALEREAKAEREQLETYLGRFRDASVRDADNAVTADARIVSRAIVPSNPSFPKKLPMILIATLAGFALSLFWVLTRALLSDRVYARRPVEMMAAMAPAPTMPPMPPAVIAAPEPASAAAPETAAPAEPAQPAATIPGLSDKSRAMRESLDRMSTVLQVTKTPAALPEIPPLPVIAQAPSMETPDKVFAEPAPSPEVQDIAAPPLAPATADLIRSEGLPQAAEASDPARLDVAETSPLFEIAEEAAACLIRGRPVSILVLGADGPQQAAFTIRALETVLKRQGPTMVAFLDPAQIAPQAVSATSKSLAGSHDFVIFNGGFVDGRAASLSRATTLTVLVAGDDEKRVDEASQVLDGCHYFIVDAETA
jgi:polysaccharide biosynthesis transport protein